MQVQPPMVISAYVKPRQLDGTQLATHHLRDVPLSELGTQLELLIASQKAIGLDIARLDVAIYTNDDDAM